MMGQDPCAQAFPASKKSTPLNPISATRGNVYSKLATSSLFPPICSPVLGSTGGSERDRNPRML